MKCNERWKCGDIYWEGGSTRFVRDKDLTAARHVEVFGVQTDGSMDANISANIYLPATHPV